MKFAGDVMSSRTSWPRHQNFFIGLGLEELSSTSSTCPGAFRPHENECNDGTGSRCEFAM